MSEVLGFPPEHMLERGQKSKRYFKTRETGDGYERIKTEKEYKPVLSRKLTDLIGSRSDGPRGLRRGEMGHTPANYDQFEDLLRRLWHYDPELRITPAEALMHDFFANPAHLEQPSIPRLLPAADTATSEASVSQATAAALASTLSRTLAVDGLSKDATSKPIQAHATSAATAAAVKQELAIAWQPRGGRRSV